MQSLLKATMLDLECASSNDQTFSSDLRRSVRTLMQLAPGTDFINSNLLQHRTMTICLQDLWDAK